jgi:hypothetical protein
VIGSSFGRCIKFYPWVGQKTSQTHGDGKLASVPCSALLRAGPSPLLWWRFLGHSFADASNHIRESAKRMAKLIEVAWISCKFK